MVERLSQPPVLCHDIVTHAAELAAMMLVRTSALNAVALVVCYDIVPLGRGGGGVG